MLKNQKGFTLIEIIAVLVILGILAAVAIPKFMSLQDDAKMANAKAGVGAGQSAVSMGYAKVLLSSAGAPGTPQAACNSVALEPAASYSLSCPGAWADSSITITAGFDGQTASGLWTRP